MTSAALHAAGHRVGRYTSPHLQRIEERFVLFEREVVTGDLRDAAATIRRAVDRLVGDGTLEGPPTFFECATAIAFELFRRHTVAIAVLEVGLGGRLGATNVVSPIAASITSIDFDRRRSSATTWARSPSRKPGSSSRASRWSAARCRRSGRGDRRGVPDRGAFADSRSR
jgi:dihydrofolate synthase/folylpolyglutamate synthase